MDRILFALAIFTFFTSSHLQSQPAQIPIQTDLDSAVAAELRANTTGLPIFNGRQHLGYPRNYIGFAYYMTEDWTEGSVLYEDIWYHQVKLKYDLSTDDLILQSPGGAGLVMIRNRISEFWLGGDHFSRNPLPGKINPAFYQLLEQGKMTLLIFHRKIVEEKVLEREVERSFRYASQYFVVTADGMHQIKRQKDLTRLLGDQRQKAIADMKSKHLSFKKNTVAAMISFVQFFNKSAR